MRGRSRASGRKTRPAKTVKRRNAPKKERQRSVSVAQETIIARLTRELNEAREQQIATGDVLKVISRSTFDLQAVLDTLVKSAARLCEADMVGLNRPRDGAMHFVANFGLPREFEEIAKRSPFVPGRGTVVGRVLLAGKPAQIADVEADPEYTFTEGQRVAGFRTVLGVPLEREGETIGVIVLIRTKVRPFTDKQIELAKSFAAQAIIAIENARLLNELRQRTDDLSESLERQTATSEVLKVISSSPGDLQPVFDAILANATNLCGAGFASLRLSEGDQFRTVSLYNAPAALAEHWRNTPLVCPHPESALGRTARTKQVIQIADVKKGPAYSKRDPLSVAGVDLGGYRTALSVPMLREDVLVGAIAIYRQEVRPFTEKQIELVKSFASQAVIAIENTRLLNELRESLRQQTATSEMLRVISASPGKLKPVFHSMLEKATQLCEASFGTLFLPEGESLRRVALHNAPAKYAEFTEKNPLIPYHQSRSLNRLIEAKQAVHVADMMMEEPGVPVTKFGNARSLVTVPMLKDNELVGAIGIYRQEVRPFTDKQIALVQNFAAQAVIAIENARLLNELRQCTDDLTESLEQQTATSEVLSVISSSPGDLAPVFDSMLSNATRLCDAPFGNLSLREGDNLRVVATRHPTSAHSEWWSPGALFMLRENPNIPLARMAVSKAPVHVPDFNQEQAYIERVPLTVGLVESAGMRAMVVVPLLKENELLGAFAIYRQEAQPFTDKQIALLQNFAAQAVIAIENARLLNELRQRTDDLSESLEQQTATTEVLKVISSSPGELEPVFQAMLENAVRICEAKFGSLFRFDGNMFRVAAQVGTPVELAEFQRQRGSFRPGPDTPFLDRVMRTKQVSHTADEAGEAVSGPSAKLGGARSLVGVPMLKDDELIGALIIYRQEVRPFTDKQIELLKNFAAQAVIAIENTRLLNELRESLQQQTATADVLKVISRAAFDLQTVLDTLVESATQVCNGDHAGLTMREGDVYRYVATYALEDEFFTFLRNRTLAPGRDSIAGRTALEGKVVHVADLAADPEYRMPEAVTVGKIRTTLGVPLLRDGVVIGTFTVNRQRVEPFTQRQIELVQTFADQAVIAIENARLLNELRQRTTDLAESLEQQTATSKVLDVISRSAFDLQAVFETVAESSVRLCGADRAFIYRFDGELLRLAVAFNTPEKLKDFVSQNPIRPGRDSASARAALERRTIHIHDVQTDPEYTYGTLEDLRTILAVPILKGDNLLGGLAIFHLQDVRPFTDKQIALVETFADQAAIAIDNVRLLDELRQSLEQQTATSEVLKVISSSPGELEPVFKTLLENAVRICGAKFGNLFVREGDALRISAAYGAPSAYVEFLFNEGLFHLDPKYGLGQLVKTKQSYQLADISTAATYGDKLQEATINMAGARSLIGLPMLKNDEVIGAIGIYRQEVQPFTDKQIELVKNFAAQAVIAIENARLLHELRQSLQQQTATADVLKVISRSAFNLQTVLDTLVESAARLCDADSAAIHRPIGNSYPYVASYGYSQKYHDYMRARPIIPGRGTVLGRAVTESKPVQVNDVEADPEYMLQEGRKIAGFRTVLGIPLLREGVPIGVIILTRNAVRPFTDKQIELATTFADQAAIAIENVRLFEAEQQRTQELAKSLEDLRAAQDRLVQTQKLASLGQLTAGIAHEIKNPLNFVNNFSGVSVELIDELQNALDGIRLDAKAHNEIIELTGTLRENLDKIVQHGKRADSIVKNMLLHSREGSGEQRPVEINALVEEGLNLAYHGARAEKQGFNITIERSFDRDAGQADLYPQEISRVLLNLISNGFYAATKRQHEAQDGYEPTLTAKTKNLGDRVEIRIRDNGTGIPPEVKEKMFNPFFTTKPAGEGTGLGLSISHDIVVKQHGGTIEVESEPGEFTEVRIVLPRAAGFSTKLGGKT
jgi:two-component system, NtrC family, sensor kinase